MTALARVCAEVERLRHDIERHIAICSEQADEIERLRSALEGVIRVADRKTDEFDAARAALAKGEKP